MVCKGSLYINLNILLGLVLVTCKILYHSLKEKHQIALDMIFCG